MTLAIVRPELGSAWTIDVLQCLPDDGFRYEIVDGSLLVSPPPAVPQVRATTRLRRIMEAQAPESLYICENVGVDLSSKTYRVPDLTVVAAAALDSDGLCLPANPHGAAARRRRRL